MTIVSGACARELAMCPAISFVLLSTFWWSASAGQFVEPQIASRYDEVNLRLKGIGLGSSYASVLRRWGRPLSSKREKVVDEYEVCGPPYTSLRLSYEGASIELMGDLRWRNFKVVSMEITSGKFLIAPGIKVGMTEKEIRSKLGVPFQQRHESGVLILNYATKGNDGGAGLHFVSGRLIKIDWEYILC